MNDFTEPGTDVRRLLAGPGHQLACGVDVDDLLEQAANGRAEPMDAHQRRCPHCQAALREFKALWDPVRDKAAEVVSAPDALGLMVSGQVRKLVADVWYTLQLNDGGAVRVAARVVATIARAAAQRVPGVRVAFGRSTQSTLAKVVEKATLGHKHPNAAVGVLGRTAVVELALAVTYGERVDEVARAVQRNVIAELRETIGLKDVTVNVTVDDVLLIN